MPTVVDYVEQHNDGVVTEFAFSILEEDKTYTRYYAIKKHNPVRYYYLGKDKLPKGTNPQTDLYFKPTSPVSLTAENMRIFQSVAKNIVLRNQKPYTIEDIERVWTR